VTWAPGGNLPPVLAAASAAASRGHEVRVLASRTTKQAGFPTLGYRRARDPDPGVAFEAQAEAMLATAAGLEIALDVRDVLEETRPDLAIVDCMLPAALAAARAAGVPAVSVVHFLYGLARSVMLRDGSAWTTDLPELNRTEEALGLVPSPDGLAAWEAPELVLVTAPRWLDLELDYPANVVHAGPLGVRASGQTRRDRVLLTFSTTVMEDQIALVRRVCDAVAAAELDAVLTLGPAIDRAEVSSAKNLEVVPFADHDVLLPKCAAVITHGGLGTVLRALAHGVPLLMLPLGRDQGFNAGRVVELGAGISLPPEAAPAEIRAALHTLLTSPGFAAAAAQAGRRIAAGEPDRSATEALEATLPRRARDPR
jgi:UDP:flavonoid glycosyltransferase YjiC (YdhE family)